MLMTRRERKRVKPSQDCQDELLSDTVTTPTTELGGLCHKALSLKALRLAKMAAVTTQSPHLRALAL